MYSQDFYLIKPMIDKYQSYLNSTRTIKRNILRYMSYS